MSTPFPGLAQENFIQRLRELREGMGLTQGQLAEKVGLKRAAVTNIEGGIGKPSVDVFCNLGRALEVSLDYLACFEEGRKPPPKWVADLMPDLESLPPAGREAVRALVKGLKK